EPRLKGSGRLLDGGQRGGRGLLKLTQLLKRLRLGVEHRTGLLTQLSDLKAHSAALRIGLRLRVVESLLQLESLHGERLRLHERLTELLGRLIAVPGDGKTQFLAAGDQGVIELHEHACAALLKLAKRQRL